MLTKRHDRPTRKSPRSHRTIACGPLAAILLSFMAAMPAAAQPASAPGNAPGNAPEHECDRLAQPPRQTMGRMPALAEGVGYGTLRGSAALAACTRAMAEHPGEARFIAFAARAANKAGDARETVRLYRLAVDQGNALAQNNLGVMYEAGEGALPRNDREAERLYRLAAEQDFPGGQANLGVLYATGHGGLPRNDREAVRLWMLAAEHEDAQAQNNLGRMYAEGRGGLPRDNREAARMWRMAADQGSTEARNNLRKLGASR